MRKWIEKILPGYSVLPLILAVSINMLVYFGTSQLRDYLTFHTITTALDEWIPFVAPFILFYVLAYIQWIANYLLVAREGKEFCYRIVYGDVAAKVICLLFFLFFQTYYNTVFFSCHVIRIMNFFLNKQYVDEILALRYAFVLFICTICIYYRLNLFHKCIIVILIINSSNHWLTYNIPFSVYKNCCRKCHNLRGIFACV